MAAPSYAYILRYKFYDPWPKILAVKLFGRYEKCGVFMIYASHVTNLASQNTSMLWLVVRKEVVNPFRQRFSFFDFLNGQPIHLMWENGPFICLM